MSTPRPALGAELINAAGPVTRLGGSPLAPHVLAAMAEAASACRPVEAWHAAASRRLAEITGAEAGLVTSGAAAAMMLATAAVIARLDFARMDRLPYLSEPCEIVVPRSHRNGYDHALRAAGATLVECGLDERSRDPQSWELAAAIGPRTVALAYFDGFSSLPLQVVVQAARLANLPVIVDAAASLPPRANLRRFIAAGADLVAFSGGKAIGGPQASGILCGRRELVASAALQMLDMDERPELWSPPPEWLRPEFAARGLPNHGIGRACKVGPEQVAGLLAALGRFVAVDEAAEAAAHTARAARLAEGLDGLRGWSVTLAATRQGWNRVVLSARLPDLALRLSRELRGHEPPIYIVDGEARAGRLELEVSLLDDAQAQIVARAIVRAVAHDA